MNHEPYIRQIPESKTVLLCIHGIVGTPRHFDFLLTVVPDDWSVYNILLDGHGKTAREFGKTSMEKWRAQVQMIFAQLRKEYDCIVIVAHSMGTLFAMELAFQYPDKVPFMLLLNVPLHLQMHLSGIVINIRQIFGKVNPANPVHLAAQNATGVALGPMIWEYIPWIPRFWELLRLMRASRCLPEKLLVPCFAFQSRKDELVSNCSAQLLRRSGKFHVTEMEHSGHYFYTPEDRERILRQLEMLCREYR